MRTKLSGNLLHIDKVSLWLIAFLTLSAIALPPLNARANTHDEYVVCATPEYMRAFLEMAFENPLLSVQEGVQAFNNMPGTEGACLISKEEIKYVGLEPAYIAGAEGEYQVTILHIRLESLFEETTVYTFGLLKICRKCEI